MNDDIEPVEDLEIKTEDENSDPRLTSAGQMLDEAIGLLQQAIRLLGQVPGGATLPRRAAMTDEDDSDARVIEGVFDGQRMIGPDGRHYSVPANYASKSKLVEGDLMKLTITGKGAFIYKQVGPVPRKRLMGALKKNTAGTEYLVRVNDHRYRVLMASVTYFHGQEGDEAVILVPESGESAWAALENVIKNGGSRGMAMADDGAIFETE